MILFSGLGTGMRADRARGIFRIPNMGCSTCTKALSNRLYKLDGVVEVSFNYINDKVYVEYDPEKTSLDEIKRVIGKISFKLVDDGGTRHS